jgi:hypothetical protein
MNGTNDFAYPLDSYQKSYRAMPGPKTLCVTVKMPHGHEAGWAPDEILMFAESVVGEGSPLTKITSQGEENGSAWVTFESGVPIQMAELHFTKETGKWQDRKWETLPADKTNGRASAPIPEGTRVFYFNVTDERGAVSSSAHVEVTE